MHRMQFMKRFIVILLCLLPLYAISSNAAETQKNLPKKTAFFQLSFFYPLSIYGMNSKQYTLNVSFNILAGYVGGIDGIEFAGLSNVDRHNVKYVQIAGLSNVVLGHFQGFQLAYSNVVLEYVKGFQAGVSNVVLKNVQGFQVGASNVVLENFKGFQAGASNVVLKNVQGFQVGASNVVLENFKGIQFGSSNVVLGNVQGFQAGSSNVVLGNFKGIQFGSLNYSQSVTGSQIGLINYSTNLSGFALGLINVYPHISDNTLPIGLINIVWGKKGYHAISVSSGLHSVATANIKLGVPHLYTFFGLDEISSKVNFHVGMGTHIPYYFKSLSSSIEVSYIHPETNYHYHSNNYKYNSVLELKGTLEYALPFYPALSPFIAVGVYDSLTPFRLKHTKFDAQLGLLYAF